MSYQELIMSPSLADTESKWLTQYAAMRQTLAEVRIEQLDDKGVGYGDDIVLEYENVTGSTSSDALWEMFDDDEQDTEYSSDELNGIIDLPDNNSETAHSRGQEWLRSKCLAYTSSRPGVDGEELQQRLIALLASNIRGRRVRHL